MNARSGELRAFFIRPRTAPIGRLGDTPPKISPPSLTFVLYARSSKCNRYLASAKQHYEECAVLAHHPQTERGYLEFRAFFASILASSPMSFDLRAWQTKSSTCLARQNTKRKCYPFRNMRALVLCFLAALPTSGQAPPALAPDLPKDPRAILQAAALHYSFNDASLKPFHLKATYQLYDEVDQRLVVCVSLAIQTLPCRWAGC